MRSTFQSHPAVSPRAFALRSRLLALGGSLALCIVQACSGAPDRAANTDSTGASDSVRVAAAGGGDLLTGDGSGVVVTGVTPGTTVTVRAYRRFLVNRAGNGKPFVDVLLFGSWGEFRADRDGRVVIDTLAPSRGTWEEADPLGLFWSMERLDGARDSARVAIPPAGIVQVVVERDGRTLDSLSLRVRPSLSQLTERVVANGTIAGAYAAPADGKRHPALLLLHGREGGDTLSAMALARRFAARGYAAFAVVYVSYDNKLPNIPTSFDSVPLELLDRSRAWLGRQPEADTSRTGLWGASKGAEFALVAASNRTWPRAIVACVPSDVVWAGFGRSMTMGQTRSGWTIGGKPLPSIPYDRYQDIIGKRATGREVHDRSRKLHVATVAAARIPVERIGAPVLMLAAEKDEVWASAEMSREIGNALERAGKSKGAALVEYPNASHGICGDGTTPAHFYGDAVPDKRATARANADAWRRTLGFFEETLGR